MSAETEPEQVDYVAGVSGSSPRPPPPGCDKVSVDYSSVTETPGEKITREAASMVMTRYHLGARVGEGKSVLEVACGSGQGLGYMASRARWVG